MPERRYLLTSAKRWQELADLSLGSLWNVPGSFLEYHTFSPKIYPISEDGIREIMGEVLGC